MSIGEKGGGRNVKILSPKQKVKRIILASGLQLCNCRKEASKKLGLDEIRTRASQFTTQIWVGLLFLNRNVITADDKKNTLYFISSWSSHSFCRNAEPTIFASLPNCGFLAQSVIAPNIYLWGTVSSSVKAWNFWGSFTVISLIAATLRVSSHYFYNMHKPKYSMFH